MNIHSVAKNICRAYSAHKSQSININKRMTFYALAAAGSRWRMRTAQCLFGLLL